ncbi:hypothetical protein [Nostoc sp. TCL240-02]|uniref:hypothetical protein n=1 Tax=Nostoc sp. TCL240-02 TaxID=2572090 RepID=UPI00157FB562|nr:hypothetical protein [Nostoc sp. TCL240-02]
MANNQDISKYAQLVALFSSVLEQSKVIGTKTGDLITNIAASVAAYFVDNSNKKQ